MRVFKYSRGSLTIEAAVIFPVFLAMMLGVINFTNVAMVYIAMDHAVSETVKQIATHAYPLKELKANTETFNLITGEKIADAGIITGVFNKVLERGSTMALETIIKELAKERIKAFYPLGELDDDNFEISRVSICNPNDARCGSRINNVSLNNEDIALVVEYRVRLPVPFFSRVIPLSNTAVERAWTDS
ncbi:TadE family protein [Phosphitispora sp. TUW77]|uniref:TadE family protein n=1 Tax=Phosphitispora sp. TUW77 TaxID=3152361 RepID=UPI003AB7764C